jgi:hypothetical protein
MTHDCRHHDAGADYLEQIFTLAACGALAGVFLLDWYSGNIVYFIKDRYFLLVLTGALLLLGLVLVRAVAVWRSAPGPGHAHEHCHGPSHDHGPGWAPWRYVVLLLPVALYFLLPADGLSGAGQQFRPGQVDGAKRDVDGKGEDFSVTFRQLGQAALEEDLRADYEGKTVRLVGKSVAQDGEQFTLVRYSVIPHDFIPLRALVLVDRSRSPEVLDGKRLNNKWVEVTGQVKFLKPRDGSSFVPAIIVRPTPEKKLTQLVRVVPVPADPFVDSGMPRACAGARAVGA